MYDNNNKSKDNINTMGIAYFNTASEQNKSMLTTKFWNSTIELVMNPKLSEDQWNSHNGKKHDMKNSISARMGVEKVQELFQRYFSEKDNFENEEEYNIPIKISTGILMISNGIQFGYAEPTMCLAIANGIDQSNGIPETVIHYEFKKPVGLSNYDARTGEFTTKEFKTTDTPQFLLLLNTLKEYAISGTMASSHNVHVGQKRMYQAIKNKFVSRDSSYNSNNNDDNYFNTTGNNGNTGSTNVSNVSNVSKDEVDCAISALQ